MPPGLSLPRLATALVGAAAALVAAEGIARLQGDHLCTSTPGAFYQADARFGWTHVPHAGGWIGGCGDSPLPAAAATVNAHGLLDAERPYGKPAGTVRILLLGGNLPEALGVARERTVARALEKLADHRRGAPLEVINAGIGGFALDNDLLFFRHEGIRYGADLVLVVIDPTFDATALSPLLIRFAGQRAPAKPYFTLEGGKPVPAGVTLPAPEAEGAETGDGVLMRSHLYRRLAGVPSRRGPPFTFLLDSGPLEGNAEIERTRALALARGLLEALRDEVAAAGGRLVAVVAPGPPPALYRAGRDFVRMGMALGVPTIDLGPAFYTQRKRTRTVGYLPGTSRWDREGHHLATHAIWSFLMREKLLPAVVQVRTLGGGRHAPALRSLPHALGTALWEGRHSIFSRYLQYGLLAISVLWVGVVLPPAGRDWLAVAVSVALVGVLGTPRLALVVLAFALVFWVAVETRWVGGRVGLGLLLAALIGGPALWPPARELRGYAVEAHQYLAAATGMAVFRFAAYAVDRRWRGVARRPLREFLAAMFFFPTFPYGPIETTERFAAGRAAGGFAPASFAALGAHLRTGGRALVRLGWGAVKLHLATLALGLLTPDVYATGGEAVSHGRLWAWIAELTLYYYLTVSGLADVAIALGALVGSVVTENFRMPFRAMSLADFWRRWNVSLGAWLRDYVYLPLGGNRRRAALNVLIVFLVSALWHAWGTLKLFGPVAYPPTAWSGFLLWGGISAAGVIVAHRLRAMPAEAPRRRFAAAWGGAWRSAATLVVVSLGWIPFFLPPWYGLREVGEIVLRLTFLR